MAAQAAITAFAETVTYTPLGGSPVAVQAVFDRPFLDADLLRGSDIATSQIWVTVWLADLGAISPAQDDGVAARATNYIVREARPDGQGMARLLLNEAP